MDIREEASAETRTQKWDKEQSPETAATKQKGIQQDPQGDPMMGVREANSCYLLSGYERSGIGHYIGVGLL
jgi:hypothetical protein